MTAPNNTIRIISPYTKSNQDQAHCTLTSHYSQMEANKMEVYQEVNYLFFLQYYLLPKINCNSKLKYQKRD